MKNGDNNDECSIRCVVHSRPTLLKGDGLAPGSVTGIARKTKNLNDAAFLDSLTEEDILIYPGYHTLPDWLSLFMVVKDVVTVRV